MKTIIGVRFKKTGKIYYFDPNGLEIEKGMPVIVETAMGDEYGETVIANKEIEEEKLTNPLKNVIRIATDKDKKMYQEYKAKEDKAMKKCEEKIKKHGLEMKLIDCEYKFDGSKLIFYFTADGRIDFRELVKDLAAIFKTRIELRQIGVRDEVKRIGGNGMCGRELCCCTFLGNFETVSIKMAKEQNISLNPSKISGNCGRLMCCLKYEQEVYEEKLKRLPKIGAIVKCEEGTGEVCGIETLKEIIKVKLTDGEDTFYRRYKLEDIEIIKDAEEDENNLDVESQEDLEELEKLEKLEEIDSKNNSDDDDIEEIEDENRNEIEKSIEEYYESVEKDILDRLQSMGDNNVDKGTKFENICLELLEKMGYGKKYRTGGSGDRGIDGTLTMDKFGFDMIGIQCKCYRENNKVNDTEITKFAHGLKNVNGINRGIFITTSDYTPQAKKVVEELKDIKIILINGYRLAKYMREYEVGVKVLETRNIYDVII